MKKSWTGTATQLCRHRQTTREVAKVFKFTHRGNVRKLDGMVRWLTQESDLHGEWKAYNHLPATGYLGKKLKN
jgi:hypothetical protein